MLQYNCPPSHLGAVGHNCATISHNTIPSIWNVQLSCVYIIKYFTEQIKSNIFLYTVTYILCHSSHKELTLYTLWWYISTKQLTSSNGMATAWKQFNWCETILDVTIKILSWFHAICSSLPKLLFSLDLCAVICFSILSFSILVTCFQLGNSV